MNGSKPIRIFQGSASYIVMTKLMFGCIGLSMGILLAGSFLSKVFLPWRVWELIAIVPVAFLMLMLVLYLVTYFGLWVHLEPERMRLFCWGIPFRSIPAQAVKLILLPAQRCGGMFCISTLSVEELAARQEARLLKSWITREEVPSRKRDPNWKCAFAVEYLHHLYNLVLPRSGKREVLFVRSSQACALLLSHLYPHAEILPDGLEQPLRWDPYTAPTAGNIWEMQRHPLKLDEQGISLGAKEPYVWQLPAERIRTIVLLDGWFSTKTGHFYRRTLLVSALESEVLIALGRENRKWYHEADGWYLTPPAVMELPIARELLLARGCDRKCASWTRKDLDSCPIPWSEKNEAALRRCCPQAQWLELRNLWAHKAVFPAKSTESAEPHS